MVVLAWHFLPADLRLGYGDGRLVQKEQRLRIEGEPLLCKHGMHGSRRLIDALSYASGPIIERVEIGVDKPYKIVEGQDKLVGNWRKTLWWIDATMILHEFACRTAEDGLRDAGVTDERCWDAIRMKRLWVQNKATDEELTQARIAVASASTIEDTMSSAGRVAAWDSALGAARGAADFTAMTAARESEKVAAWAAPAGIAGTAATLAAWNATWDEVKVRQNRRLTAMVCAAYRKEWRNG